MRAARSFFSIFIGWCAAMVTQVCWQVFGDGFGYVTDFDFFVSSTAMFTFLGWLLFVLPALVHVSDSATWMRFPQVTLTSSCYAVIVYFILICSWLQDAWKLAWFPAIVGALGGATYALLDKWQATRRFPRASTIALFVSPFAGLVLFAFVAWPLIIQHTPYVAYVFGSYESRDQAQLKILKSIRKGDTYVALHRKYPRLFARHFQSLSGNGSDYEYRIVLDETGSYVMEISVRSSRRPQAHEDDR